MWNSNDTKIAAVGLNGGASSQAVVTTKNVIGTSLVTASDVKNTVHFDTAQVNIHHLLIIITG